MPRIDEWTIPGLDITQTSLVATLCMSDAESGIFRAHVNRVTFDNGLKDCHTVVEFARAILMHRLEYLKEP